MLYLHNKVEISGGERSLLNLWANLEKNKFKLFLAVPSYGKFVKEAKNENLEIVYLSVPKFSMRNIAKIFKKTIFLVKYIKKNKINLIHSYTPRNNILSSIAGKICRIPVIWHERNIVFGNEADITKKLTFFPDAIICNSYAVAQRFQKNGGIPSKVKVILNGVNTTKFYPRNTKSDLLKKYQLNGKKVVGIISNLSKRKMPEYFLNACPYILKNFPDIKFILVGDEFDKKDKGRKKELKKTVHNLGMSNHIIFTGFLSDVSDIIQIFDIGVSVTEKEACSRAIIEIMSSGKPVVAFDTGGNRELIRNGITGILVPFNDMKEYAASIVDLLKNNEKRINMGRLARKRAEKYFDIRLNSQQTQNLYMDLIRRNNLNREILK